MITKVFKILLAGLLCSACYWDNEETLYGTTQDTCDLSAVTYNTHVVPILEYNCYACHSSQAASALGGNIVLDKYNILVNYVNNGRLMGSIKHLSGYEAMPKSAAKLSDCDIQKIETWINNGALEN